MLEYRRGRRNSQCRGEIRRDWEEHRWRRRPDKSGVKACGSTTELPSILSGLRPEEVSGTASVEVKFVDIRKNTSGEGG